MSKSQDGSNTDGGTGRVGMWLAVVLIGGVIPACFFIAVALSPR